MGAHRAPTVVRALRRGALALLLSAALPAAAGAQSDAPLYVRPHPETGALEMRLGNVFEDQALVRALHSGLPLRIQVEAELWKDGFFDSQQGKGGWRASVVYDPKASDFSADVAKIKAAGADAIVLIGFDESAQIIQELVKQGIGPNSAG